MRIAKLEKCSFYRQASLGFLMLLHTNFIDAMVLVHKKMINQIYLQN